MDVLQYVKMPPHQLDSLLDEWLATPAVAALSTIEQDELKAQWESEYHHQIAMCVLDALPPVARRMLLHAVLNGQTLQAQAVLANHMHVLHVAVVRQTAQFVSMHCNTEQLAASQVVVRSAC